MRDIDITIECPNCAGAGGYAAPLFLSDITKSFLTKDGHIISECYLCKGEGRITPEFEKVELEK